MHKHPFKRNLSCTSTWYQSTTRNQKMERLSTNNVRDYENESKTKYFWDSHWLIHQDQFNKNCVYSVEWCIRCDFNRQQIYLYWRIQQTTFSNDDNLTKLKQNGNIPQNQTFWPPKRSNTKPLDIVISCPNHPSIEGKLDRQWITWVF